MSVTSIFNRVYLKGNKPTKLELDTIKQLPIQKETQFETIVANLSKDYVNKNRLKISLIRGLLK